MPKPEVIIVRTHFYDHELDLFVQDLRRNSGRTVVIAADETAHPVICPSDIQKIVINPKSLSLRSGRDIMWRCGDYSLYAVANQMTDADTFWMIEPDVRIHSNNIREFFDTASLNNDSDFLTPWFVESSPAWSWYSMMSPYASRIFNCMMQLCRFSRTAIELLYEKRAALSAEFDRNGKAAEMWPNDEAFVGATLVAGGMTISDLKQQVSDYDFSGTFTFTKPVSLCYLKNLPSNRKVYHPVVRGEKFLTRANTYLRERQQQGRTAKELIDEFGHDFVDQIGLEGGSPAVERFLLKLKDAARVNAPSLAMSYPGKDQ